MRRLALLALLTACATARPPPVRLAVARTFSCYACPDRLLCQPHSPVAPQLRLPGIDLDERSRVKLAADDSRLCALVDADLHCWDHPDYRGFRGHTVEPNIADVAVANAVRCIVDTAGAVRCHGSPRVHSDWRDSHVTADGTIVGVEVTINGLERVVDEHRVVPDARARFVAAYFWGACYADRHDRVRCWQWAGDQLHDVRPAGSPRVVALRGLADALEITTAAGTRTVAFDPYRFDAPPRIRVVVPPPDDRSWVHSHGVACRITAERTIVCNATARWDGHGDSAGPFPGWPEPPRCDLP